MKQAVTKKDSQQFCQNSFLPQELKIMMDYAGAHLWNNHQINNAMTSLQGLRFFSLPHAHGNISSLSFLNEL